jgi:chromate transporter
MSVRATPAPAPSIADLLFAFARISLLGFGGALPWAHRALVERRGWLSSREFADTLSLCQFLPGPTIVNMAIVLGARAHGPAGALAGVLGLLLPPSILVTLVGIFYEGVHTNPYIARALAGIAAAASGLLAATAGRLLLVLVRSNAKESLGIAAIGFAALAFARLSLPLTLVVLAPISVALAWRRVR